MNRRELAKNAVMGICGALLGRLTASVQPAPTHDTSMSYRLYYCVGKDSDGWKEVSVDDILDTGIKA